MQQYICSINNLKHVEMGTVIALFEQIQIKRIQFEAGDSDVMLNCELKQNNQMIDTTLFINFSDLNRLLAKLQNRNESIDYASLFEVFPIGEKSSLYELNTSLFDDPDLTIDEMAFYHPVKQIRA